MYISCFSAQFQGDESDLNMLHGSDTVDNAENELSKLFNVQQTFAVIKPDAMSQKGIFFSERTQLIKYFFHQTIYDDSFS